MLQARNTAIAHRHAPERVYRPAVKEVPVKERSRLGVKKLIFLLLTGCFLLALIIIAQYSSMVTLQYRLGGVEKRMDTLQEEFRQLEQEAARLSSLARIETIARSELGMQEPENGQIRVLTAVREDGSTRGE
ncbi:MAG: cell division protein FtsL [Firmicutes bacterium]|nr:cell division protein FtsL [Bacillota bacterium]